VVASLSTLRQRSGSTPHDAVTVDPRLSSHQSVSLALDRQRSHSRQAANFARPRTANVASQGRAARRSPYSLGKTSAQTPSIQTHQASRRDQIPIVLAESPLHHPPRFRALALFGRRPHQRVDSSIIPATENLHRKRPSAILIHVEDAIIFCFASCLECACRERTHAIEAIQCKRGPIRGFCQKYKKLNDINGYGGRMSTKYY
jgi:hypothetical protein